jgi:hypothetical protein
MKKIVLFAIACSTLGGCNYNDHVDATYPWIPTPAYSKPDSGIKIADAGADVSKD